jgi:uncharacterized protein GlcG (DUF336 family)
MCVAVTDESGNLIAFERMDGGKITSITLAIDKSFTAPESPTSVFMATDRFNLRSAARL